MPMGKILNGVRRNYWIKYMVLSTWLEYEDLDSDLVHIWVRWRLYNPLVVHVGENIIH